MQKVRELYITFRAHLYETALRIGLPRVFEWIDALDAANQDKDEAWIVDGVEHVSADRLERMVEFVPQCRQRAARWLQR